MSIDHRTGKRKFPYEQNLILDRVEYWQQSNSYSRAIAFNDATLPFFSEKTIAKAISADNNYGSELLAEHGEPTLDLLMIEHINDLVPGLQPLKSNIQEAMKEIDDKTGALVLVPGAMFVSGSLTAALIGQGNPLLTFLGFVIGTFGIPAALFFGNSRGAKELLRQARANRILARYPHLRKIVESCANETDSVKVNLANQVFIEEIERLTAHEIQNHQRNSEHARS